MRCRHETNPGRRRSSPRRRVRPRRSQSLRSSPPTGRSARAAARSSGGSTFAKAIKNGLRAIAARPAIVLADESTANIDSANADALLEMVETLNREQQVTFLFSTHDPRVMARARRLVRLVDGRIESDESRT